VNPSVAFREFVTALGDGLAVGLDGFAFGEFGLFFRSDVEEESHISAGVAGDQIFFTIVVPIHNLWMSTNASPRGEADFGASRLHELEILERWLGVAPAVQVQTNLSAGKLSDDQVLLAVAVPVGDAGDQMPDLHINRFVVRLQPHALLKCGER
jgi:hypothetical protein